MSQTTPCRTCGAPLAPDQRYCVGCGTRVAAPRLDFVAEAERAEAEALNRAAPGVAAGPGAAVAGPSLLDKLGGPMGAAAIALVSLGVGFLLGQTRAATPPAQRPPVVKIENATPSDGAEATAGDAAGDAGVANGAGAGTADGAGAGTADGAGATDAAGAGDDAGAGATGDAGASEATTPTDGGAETETNG